MVWNFGSHPYKYVPVFVSFVLLFVELVVRKMDVGAIGVTIVAGTMVVVDAIDTGKNVDVARNDAFEPCGDNVLYGLYMWRFSVCVAFVGIKMWWVCCGGGGPDGNIDGGGDGDDWNGNLFPMESMENKKLFSFEIKWNFFDIFDGITHLNLVAKC